MIDLSDVSCGYGGVPLLTDVSMALAPGSFHFLTGPSGSGKTTLLRLCHGALRPQAGRVTVLGRDLRGMARDQVALLRRRIGMLDQDCRFLDHLDVAQNVGLPLLVAARDPDRGVAGGTGRARGGDPAGDLDALLGWVGLLRHKHARPAALSGGERQRAALARAVILSPEIVLADEPTGNLDWDMSLRLLDLLVDLNRMGKTILIASHDLNLIRTAKTRVAARVLRIGGQGLHVAGADL